MKITFDTPLNGTDASGNAVTLTAAQIAALTYTIFLDTVNPPVKTYPVPAADLTAATANANGSKRVTVNATDLGVTPVAGTTYYVAVEDSLGNAVSPESPILTYLDVVTPGSPANFSVS